MNGGYFGVMAMSMAHAICGEKQVHYVHILR